jgi:hypothetical protein
MSTTRSHLRRRLLSVVTAGALAAATVSFAAPAQAADVPGEATGSGPTHVTDATFTWGLSGYAQKGVFGPWTFKDLAGDVSQLDGASQTEYSTEPVPATSFPASGAPNPKANAVKFTGGTGTIDTSTGAGKLSWTGRYVVNAYPSTFNAPNETYEDPQLTVAADGSGFLTVDFSIGAGTDMSGNPFEAQEFGRLKLATFDAGSLSARSDTGYRVTPDYQGVENGLSGQTKTCTTSGGATGWWGSWPQPFIDALNSHASGQSVLPHFYSTGCGGNQDLKPPLPIDVAFHAADAPHVTVSNTKVNPDGTTTVTVTGENFDPALATGTRPPLSGSPAGSYVAFGKFAANWRPSTGAASTTRKTATSASGGLKWAVPADKIAAVGGAAAGAIELSADGGFETDLTVDKAALDAIATDPGLTNYGIYTYPGSGGVAPAYETYVPLTFSSTSEGSIDVAGVSYVAFGIYGTKFVATVSGASGTVTVTGAGETKTLTVADHKVTYNLPRGTPVGTHTLKFVYSGDDASEGAEVTKSLKITPRGTKTTSAWGTKPTSKTSGSIKVTVVPLTSGVTPTGKVNLVLTKGATKYTRPQKTLSSAKATLAVPKLAKGTWTVRINYAPTVNYLSSSKQFTIAVK